MNLDLKDNQITLGELLDYPPAAAALKKRFPMGFRHPVTGASRTVTLAQLLSFAQPRLPQRKLDEALEELRKV